MTIIYSI